jgi:DNA repair protein RadA/Sms
VAQAAGRLKEAQKLGFARAVVPEAARTETGDPGVNLTTVTALVGLVSDIAARGEQTSRNQPGDRFRNHSSDRRAREPQVA